MVQFMVNHHGRLRNEQIAFTSTGPHRDTLLYVG